MFGYMIAFPGGKEKALTLSYDDGVDTDIEMLRLLEKYGIKCTFNLNAGLFNPNENARPAGKQHIRLSKSQAKELFDHPLCEVATHGYYHPSYKLLPESMIATDILDDRRALEDMFGTIIRGHAYPYGDYTDGAVDILKKAGIVYARTTLVHHSFRMPQDWLRLESTCHHNDPQLEEMAHRFVDTPVSARENGRLFYLWGHTYEFRYDDNWDVIERFFQTVSGKADVWYATNIEIYDYAAAWNSLIYGADGSQVYNPTATDLWVKVVQNPHAEARIVAVPAGKKVRL